jgi:hypothetical protein
MNPDFQLEMLSYDEKISLSKLEESKAASRVKELEYQKARFALESFLASLKQHQQAQMAQQQSTGSGPAKV